jgi:hypothetical protein
MATRKDLLTAVSVTGNGAFIDWPGGPGVFVGEGTIGGSALKLQMETTSGAGVDLDPSLTFTTLPNAYGFMAPSGRLRAVLTGGAPVSINAYVASIPQT